MIRKKLGELKWHDRFTYKKNIVFDESDLNQKGAKFQIVKFPENTTIKPHYHKKVTEIFYILSGKGTFSFNGKKTNAKKHDMMLCQPRDVHEISNNAKKELVILIFKTNENPRDICWIKRKTKAK